LWQTKQNLLITSTSTSKTSQMSDVTPLLEVRLRPLKQVVM